LKKKIIPKIIPINWYIIAGLILIIVFFIILKTTKEVRREDEEKNSRKEKEEKSLEGGKEKIQTPPPEGDLKDYIDYLQREKRVTQKEMRKQFPVSEAKISLILAELESKGKIEKLKKGRGNIIIWKG